ncbi:hypothetical protein HYDPIDRAFT_33290 [Hydnomerulius pinastri MD-312]|uniref:Uncharacterized protein n=1 Tax=Hydnomerulius pinastri MD-312 TaxID=994086 RepID=A0A0C9VNV0_9AGAM|nr:hypothetical protein HYDPIDRAFT_33290 [Hydnomerulius pinastri MD-312]
MTLNRPPIEGGFDWLFFQCNNVQLEDEGLHDILLNTLYSHTVTCTKLERAICLITRSISVSQGRPSLMAALLSLLSAVLEGVSSRLSKEDLRQLQVGTVVGSAVIHELCVSDGLANGVHEELQKLAEASFSSTDAEDQMLVPPISSQWAEGMKAWLESGYFEGLKYTRPWVELVDTEELSFSVNVIEGNPEPRSSPVCAILEDILAAMQPTITGSHGRIKAFGLKTFGFAISAP